MPLETEEFTGTVKKETTDAWLLVIDGDDYWIPKSQLQDGTSPDIEEGSEATVVIPQWLAEKKGLL
jgi:hypothetical protein